MKNKHLQKFWKENKEESSTEAEAVSPESSGAESDAATANGAASPGLDTPDVMSGLNAARGDVKASTVARMMGLMTVSDLTLFESKIDLMATKINNFGIRMERLTGQIESIPGGSDFERIEAQLASMRTLLKEFMGVSASHTTGTEAAKSRRERAVVSSSTQEVREKADAVLESSVEDKEAEPVAEPEAPAEEAVVESSVDRRLLRRKPSTS